MENLNSESIVRLRSLFTQMNISRRQLRPILFDIAEAIDKGFFIDADSEEVNQLLQKILNSQKELAACEQIKKSVITKKIEQIDRNILQLEQNSVREEINSILTEIGTLVVDSDEPAIIDAVRKVKLQAEHLRGKASKFDTAQFAKAAERFVTLSKIINNADNFSPADFISITNSFSDNPLIAMVLTSKLVHFPKIEEEVLEPEEIINKFIPTKHRINAVTSKVEKIKPDMNLILTEHANFSIQKTDSKKNLSVKSFGNKIHQLFDSVDPLPIFKILIRTRLFIVDDPCNFIQSSKFAKKIAAIVPRLFAKLFDWGIVDKITWRGREFYFLNDFGLDLCVRSFTRSSPNVNSNSNYYEDLFHALQFAFFFLFDNRFKNNLKINFAFSTSLPAARAKSSDKLYFFFSLILLGEDWVNLVATFKIFIENEMDDNLSVILFALSKEDLNWLKVFDTVKFKKVPFFMFTCDGFFDQDFNEVDIDSFFKLQPKNAPVNITPKTPPEPKFSQAKIETPEEKNVPEIEEIADEVEEIADEVEEIQPETESEVVEVQAEIPEKKIEPEIVEVQPITEKTSTQDIEIADLLNRATSLFDRGEKVRGMLAINALSDIFPEDSDSWLLFLSEQVGFILDDPMNEQRLSSLDTFSLCSENSFETNNFIGNSFGMRINCNSHWFVKSF